MTGIIRIATSDFLSTVADAGGTSMMAVVVTCPVFEHSVDPDDDDDDDDDEDDVAGRIWSVIIYGVVVSDKNDTGKM